MAATYRLTYHVDGNPTRIKDDFAAAGAPTVDDDAASGGWSTGSLWYVPTTDTLYICESAAAGAADWIAVTGGGPGGGAPTDATYLVGAASAGLSDEVVVGMTPGGELGGTWAAPTVDTTHAGSSHADVQAAAEATAAGALTAHAGDADAHHAWPLTEPDIPASIARDSEVTGAVATHTADASAHHARYTDAEADARAAAAITSHEAALDPHPGYLTAAEGDAAYEPLGEVATHAADPDAHHTWPLTDGDIPAAIARDSEVDGAISSHASTADAHHTRYTDAEADARAALAVATHAGAADAHHAWPLADGDIPASIARDTEVASAIATHEAAADPHPGYVPEAATPGGELGGTYAAPTVDTVHAGSSHAATQAAAEATAAAALASHAGDPDAHHDEGHAARHAAGGADALKLDDLAAPDDTTDLDASTGAHGLLPKLSGSTSQYLRGDGAWATPAGSVSPQAPVVHVYTASSTWAKPTDAGFSHIVVEVQGGGGGGGGVAGTSANESSVSTGGGGGGYARKLLGASALSGSYTVTVGAGGTRGAAGNNNGSDGGASSFAGSGITTVQGNGGKGGEGDGGGTGFNIHDGGEGGTASGGDINRAGDGGGNAVRTSFAGVTGSRPSYHAHGGGSFLAGMRRQPDLDVAGADGRAYGGGGTGCSLNASTTGKPGGDGAAGVVIVTEYCMGVAG